MTRVQRKTRPILYRYVLNSCNTMRRMTKWIITCTCRSFRTYAYHAISCKSAVMFSHFKCSFTQKLWVQKTNLEKNNHIFIFSPTDKEKKQISSFEKENKTKNNCYLLLSIRYSFCAIFFCGSCRCYTCLALHTLCSSWNTCDIHE